MRHQYRLTDQNEFAFTACCTNSQRLQLGFGNITLLMQKDEFSRLLTQVEDTFLHISNREACPCCRTIIIETSVKNMVFSFSHHELELLLEVMQKTHMLLQAHHIINPN
jgi:hypothetical protein